MAKVKIYTTPTCTYCNAAKRFFRQHGINYKEVDVSRSVDQAQRMVEKSGQTGVPVIEVDGQVIVGFDKRRLLRALGMR